jgi:hypothetical protein
MINQKALKSNFFSSGKFQRLEATFIGGQQRRGSGLGSRTDSYNVSKARVKKKIV